jgi:hypothetical protein
MNGVAFFRWHGASLFYGKVAKQGDLVQNHTTATLWFRKNILGENEQSIQVQGASMGAGQYRGFKASPGASWWSCEGNKSKAGEQVGHAGDEAPFYSGKKLLVSIVASGQFSPMRSFVENSPKNSYPALSEGGISKVLSRGEIHPRAYPLLTRTKRATGKKPVTH